MFFIKNLLVFFGGKSPERDISVITGLLTLNSIDKSLFNAIPIYIDGKGIFYTGEKLKRIDFYKQFNEKEVFKVNFLFGERAFSYKKGKKEVVEKIYCAINCMHGRGGEDGCFSALARLLEVAFVGPDIYASALTIDKDFTKNLLNGMQIKNAEYIRIKRSVFFEKSSLVLNFIAKKIGYPLIVKPARLGSSIGITKVDSEKEIFSALCQAFNYDDKVICEQFLSGAVDINCAVYSIKNKRYASRLEQAMHVGDILSFADKYSGGDKCVGSERKPANWLDESVKEQIINTSKEIYRLVDFKGIVRFDYLVRNNEVYLNEINSVPGSLAYYLFCDKLNEFTALLTKLIEDAVEQKIKEDNLLTFYSSNVLYCDYKSIKK